MSVWKIVSGILSIVLCFFVIFQSCAAGIANALAQNGDVSGSAGIIVAILLLVGGIVSIATRNAVGNGGNISIIVLYGIAAEIGYMMAGIYTDLLIWSTWCLICAVIAAMAIAADNVCGPLVYIIIAVVGIVIAVVGFGMNLGRSESKNTESGSTKKTEQKISESENEVEDFQVIDAKGENGTDDSGNSNGAGELDGYPVEIKSAALANDYDGNQAIIVTYSWTNNGEETTSAVSSFLEKAFQGGVELDSAIVEKSDIYDSDLKWKDIKPGTTFEVQCAFVLRDSSSPVEIEITKAFSFCNDIVTKEFDLSTF